MISFTREYEELGRYRPEWQSPGEIIRQIAITQNRPGVDLAIDLAGIEIYADQLLEKVVFNLFDNSFRHGGKVTRIRVSAQQADATLVIIWQDNGVGIPGEDKEMIFMRGYGKNTGLGLFLVREILGLTGITIRESGDPGKGARFEIMVPQAAYRIAGAMKI
jgi:signal transduction histidine kinase